MNSIQSLENLEIQFQKQKGYGAAIIEGIDNCETEYCCIINADGSMDPKYLSEMLALCKDKDLVFAQDMKKMLVVMMIHL